jgi:hypothetical protein
MRLTFDPRLCGTYLETNIVVLRVYTRFMKSAAQPTFDPMILWISWFDLHNSRINMTRRPKMSDKNVLIPNIGRSKCCAGHFWSHDLVDLMFRSSPFVDQNDAQATFSGSDCFVPQHWGIKITGCIKLRDALDFWSQTQWNLFGNQYLCFASLYPNHEKCRAAHFWSHDFVDLMVWSPREGHMFGIRLFCAPALGDENYRMCKTKGWGWLLIPDSVELIWKPISLFCEFISDSCKVPRCPLLIPWSCGFHALILTRRPHFRDQIVLCPSIGGWKLQVVLN